MEAIRKASESKSENKDAPKIKEKKVEEKKVFDPNNWKEIQDN